MVLPDCVRFSCCSPIALIRLNCCSSFTSVCVRFSCCLPLVSTSAAAPDCFRFNCSSMIMVIVQNYTIWSSHAGRLPPPDNVRINGSILEWDPPYSVRNNESDILQVDPLVTQYTVNVIDNCTGNIIHEVNVTDRHHTIRSDPSDGDSCLVYGITPWNSGGEGRMSVPVYLPQSKLAFFWNIYHSSPLFIFCILVPRRIAAENVVITPESEGDLDYIYIQASYQFSVWCIKVGRDQTL